MPRTRFRSFFPDNPSSQKEIAIVPGATAIKQVFIYFKKNLEHYKDSEFIQYLVAPSPKTLVQQFQCGESDIYQALDDLCSHGYQYESVGYSSPILLWDPLLREKS